MRLLLFITVFISFSSAFAQTQPDTVILKEITVKATRIHQPLLKQPISVTTINSIKIDALSGGTISEVLNAHAPVYVRTNGPGGLSTLSQRGYSSSQTQILWNGFQLNHSMLGLTDLSLIPAFAVGQITVASGNGNTSFGEKGGGTVALQTKEPENELGVSQTIGSFNKSITETYAGVHLGKWSFSLVTGLEKSDNNFGYSTREFNNEAGGFITVRKQRSNNEVSSKTGILSIGWKEHQKNFISTFWLYDASNNIPGGISSPSPQASQEDSYFRWMSRFTTTTFGQKLTSKLYVNRQKLDFFNPASNIDSRSTSNSVIGDVELLSELHQTLDLVSSLQIGHSYVNASDYSGKADRSQFSLQTHPHWQPVERVNLYGGLRFDYYSDFKEAYSASFGTNIEILTDHLFLKGQISRNFVAPTFNDLYWPGLGNPDLNPETNIKYETGLLLDQMFSGFAHSTELTLYDGIVEEGIRWLPIGGSDFRPVNLESARLFGFEIKENLQFWSRDFHLDLQTTLLHTKATLTEPRFEGDRAEDKQLRYTPEWQLKASAFLKWKSLVSVFSYNFTEERFSSADHQSPFDPLPSYEEATWSTSIKIKKGNFGISPQFTVQNLFDEDYVVILDYPMPGRNYQLKLTINYKLN